jgi:hypothetical protein
MGTPMDACEHPEDKLPDDFEDVLLDRRQASAYLESIGIRRKPATLAKLYCIGADGPPCVHDGRRVLYPKRLLHLWGVRQLTAVRKSSREARAQMQPRDGAEARNL